MAQTAEEIVSRMDAEMSKHDESEGLAITMDVKIIIIGTISSRSYTKGTYWPVSLSTSMTGASVTMRDISFGVTEKQVTFDANQYPGATIIDKR